MENVLEFLDSYSKLPKGLREYLLNNLRTIKVDAGTILVREGDPTQTIGFIEEGLIRGFKMPKNTELTTWFMGKGDVFVSIRAFFKQKELARETIETLQPCIIHSLTYPQYEQLYTKWPQFNYHRAELLLKYYLLADEREEMRHLEAKERFFYLQDHYKHFMNQVADKYLASFISVTPSYFSTLKHKYGGNGSRHK